MRAKTTLVLLLAGLLWGVAAAAQSLRGAIGGVVTDASGKPIPDTRVSLFHEETNKQRNATTSEQGEFFVTLLSPGSYRVEVERAGYRRHVQRVTLLVNQELQLEIPLLPGRATEAVEVTAARGLLKTDSAALGTVIETWQLRNLPLDGRNFFELSLLLPGTAPAAPGSAGSVRGDFAMNINGAREDSNSFLLDGAYDGDPKLNGVGLTPPVDAIREFEVLAGNYDASFGRNAGGQVNVVLQSGSNQFHGVAYEFLRNAALDARNFFAASGEPNPQYLRNQFGASLGGPIRRDRTFFFSDYEGRRVREGITRVTNVPTGLERAGDFSRSILPPPIDLFTGQPFPNGRIPLERRHPVGAAIAALYPLPNRADPRQNFVSSPAQRDRDDHFDVRLDYTLGKAADLSVRYSFADRSLFEPFAGPQFAAVPGYGNNVPRRAQNLLLSGTHALSPVLLNEVRVAFHRVAAGAFQQNLGNSINRGVGLPELSPKPRDFGLSFITVTGFSSLGDERNNPQHSVSNTYQVLDHLSYARGRQLWKFGFNVRAVQQNAFRDVQARGFLTFLGFTGNALAELLQGFPSLTGGARLDNAQHLRTRSYNGFVQYNSRLGPNLSLSAGLRYEYNSPPVDTEDRANTYDPAQHALVRVGTNNIPRSGYGNDRNNFAPRLGLAWTLGKGGTTVLRAGYGIYYDQFPLAPGEGLYFNPPFFDFKLYFSLPGLPLTLSDPFPKFFPIALPSSALAYQRDLSTPYLQHWSFGVQQELGKKRVLEVSYVGSKGTKLLTARDINQPRPSQPQPGQLFPPRPVPQFDDINLLESRSNSVYHGLEARFLQRLDFGLSVLASYTWAKSLDDASSFFSSAGDPNFPQDSQNVRAERGRSNFDLRHRLSLSYSYDIPIGKGRGLLGAQGWLSSLLAGWQTNGILSFQTGAPFTVALLPDLDNSNTGRSILGFGANDRPDRLRDGRLSRRTLEQWFDTSAFSFRPVTFGNSGRNILDGPGLQTVNVSLVKNIQLREATSLQFRAEAFNLFNRANFDLPDIFMGSPTFGRIQSAQSPRRVQFGLKFLF